MCKSEDWCGALDSHRVPGLIADRARKNKTGSLGRATKIFRVELTEDVSNHLTFAH